MKAKRYPSSLKCKLRFWNGLEVNPMGKQNRDTSSIKKGPIFYALLRTNSVNRLGYTIRSFALERFEFPLLHACNFLDHLPRQTIGQHAFYDIQLLLLGTLGYDPRPCGSVTGSSSTEMSAGMTLKVSCGYGKAKCPSLRGTWSPCDERV